MRGKSQLSRLNNYQNQLKNPYLETGEGSFVDVEIPHHPVNIPQRKKKISEVIRRQILLIGGVAIATTTAAFSWTLNQPYQYQGQFQLLVEPVKEANSPPKMLPDAMKNSGLAPVTPGATPFDYDSQIEVLQSQKVMEPIIKQIQTRYPDVNYANLLQKNPYQKKWGNNSLLVKRLNNTKIIEVTYQDMSPKKVQFILEKVGEGYLKYSTPSKPWIEKAIQLVQSKVPTLQKEATNIKGEMRQLQEKYNFIDPQIQSKQISEQNSQIQAQQLEVSSQLNQQQALYDILQVQLGLDPKQALTAIALSQSPRYQGLLTQLQQLEVKLAIDSATFTDQTPQILTQQDQHKNIVTLLNEEAKKILGDELPKANPQILAYQDSVRLDLTKQLIGAANQIQVLKVRQKVLNQAGEQLKKYAQDLPGVASRYLDLQRQLEMTNNQLNSLMQKSQSLELDALAQQQGSWELISKPEVPRDENGVFIPAFPILPLNVALGGLGGVLLGIGLAYLVEGVRNKKVFQSPEEVKYSIRLPLLGVIPATDHWGMLPPVKDPTLDIPFSPTPSGTAEKTAITYDTPRSAIALPTDPFQESFRGLNANLRLYKFEKPIRSCVVTSCQIGDGKSTVAVNLAIAAAAMGQKVLLVDADLRRPQVHRMLDISNEEGLSNVIRQDLEVEKVIQRSRFDHNLHILTSGNIPIDPTKLLSSAQMSKLMEKLANQYDLVIYDTPPLLGLADANLLGVHTDGLMLVVGLHQTEREGLLLALEDVKMAGIPLLGMVANGDKTSRSYYQYYSSMV